MKNQPKPEPNEDRPKRPVGQPPIVGIAQIRTSVMIPPDNLSLYNRIGRGNISRALRIITQHFVECEEKNGGRQRSTPRARSAGAKR